MNWARTAVLAAVVVVAMVVVAIYSNRGHNADTREANKRCIQVLELTQDVDELHSTLRTFLIQASQARSQLAEIARLNHKPRIEAANRRAARGYLDIANHAKIAPLPDCQTGGDPHRKGRTSH